MELRQYLALARKWAWLILLTVAISAGSSYYYSRNLTPIYQAQTTLSVGQTLQNPNPSGGEFLVASQLAQAYAVIVTQQPVIQATAEAINWQDDWRNLTSKVAASAPGGQLLQITVTDSDPARAKLIADEVARQLILQSPTSSQQKQEEEQRAFVSNQLKELKVQIETAQKSLSELTAQAALENDSEKLKDLNSRSAVLQAKIDGWQRNYASLSALLTRSSSNFLTVLAPAQQPSTPVGPNIPQNILFATFAALVLAVAAIFLLEYLDDTIKDGDDVQRILNLSTLGAITRIRGIHQATDHLVTIKQPRSPIAEAYRVLRTNLRFSGIENPSGALLVTSSGPSEGKTTTATNLAATIAQAGKRVVLVDADLRRPSVHKLFGLPNSLGLSSLFLGDNIPLAQIIQPTFIEGLNVITSGPLPPNPAEVLDSKQMNELIAELRAQADMVIIDSPPALAVADASIIGSRCSGAVLVIDTGHTRSEMAQRGLETLTRAGVKVFGVVLNKLSARRGSGYYYYYYDSPASAKAKPRGSKPAS